MIMGYTNIPERFFDIVKMKEHVENQKNSEGEIRKLKKSKVLICNDVNSKSNKRFLSRNVGTKIINGSEIKNSSMNKNEIIRGHGDHLIQNTPKDSKMTEKPHGNGSSTGSTYKGEKNVEWNDKENRETEKREKDTGSKCVEDTIGKSYVRETEFNDISDVSNKILPSTS